MPQLPRAAAQAAGLIMLLLTLLLRGCADDTGSAPDPTDEAGAAVPTAPPALQPSAVVDPPTAGLPSGPLQVDAIRVTVLESDPPQVQVVVDGTLPDPCASVGPISQSRDGTAVTVAVETVTDPDAFCAAVLQPVQTTVPLDGDFPAGTYTVTVNGVTETFTV